MRLQKPTGYGPRTTDPLLIYLRALKLARVVHVHGFPLGENIQYLGAAFAMTVASRLGAAERKVDFGPDRRRVHIKDSRPHVFHRVKGPVSIASIDLSRKAVLHTVGNLDRVIQIAAFEQR